MSFNIETKRNQPTRNCASITVGFHDIVSNESAREENWEETKQGPCVLFLRNLGNDTIQNSNFTAVYLP